MHLKKILFFSREKILLMAKLWIDEILSSIIVLLDISRSFSCLHIMAKIQDTQFTCNFCCSLGSKKTAASILCHAHAHIHALMAPQTKMIRSAQCQHLILILFGKQNPSTRRQNVKTLIKLFKHGCICIYNRPKCKNNQMGLKNTYACPALGRNMQANDWMRFKQ